MIWKAELLIGWECYSQYNCFNCATFNVKTYLVSERLVDVDTAAHEWLFLFVGVISES